MKSANQLINFRISEDDEQEVIEFIQQAQQRRRITYDLKSAMIIMQHFKKVYGISDTREIVYLVKNQKNEGQQND